MKSIGIYGTYDLTHGFINIFYFLFNFHNLLTWHLLTNLRREIHENDILLPKNNSHTPETTSKTACLECIHASCWSKYARFPPPIILVFVRGIIDSI